MPLQVEYKTVADDLGNLAWMPVIRLDNVTMLSAPLSRSQKRKQRRKQKRAATAATAPRPLLPPPYNHK